MKSYSVKNSYGIALFNPFDKNLRMLMVKKRCSYHFAKFVRGKYDGNDIKQIEEMFNFMTPHEKLVIASQNFQLIWYTMWLFNPDFKFNPIYMYDKEKKEVIIEYEAYTKCWNKFDKNFLYNKALNKEKLFKKTKCIEGIWEIPKGGKCKDEKNLDCAIREFEEEIKIGKGDYQLLSVNPMTFTHTDDNVTYHKHYFLAELTNESWKPQISFDNYSYIAEVGEIRWFYGPEIKNINSIPKITNHLFYQYTKLRENYMSLYSSLKVKKTKHSENSGTECLKESNIRFVPTGEETVC